MKNIHCLWASLLIFFLFITSSQLYGQPGFQSETEEVYVALVQHGMPIYLESRVEFTTKFLKEGDNLIFHVKFPVVVENEVVIPKGREAVCRINRLEKPGGGGKPGFMEIQPLYIKLGRDKVLPLTSEPSGHGGRERQAASMAYSQATMAASQSMMELHHYQENKRMEQQSMNLDYGPESLILPAGQMPPPPPQAMMSVSGYPPPDPMMYQSYAPAPPAMAMGKGNNGGLLKVAQAVNVVGPLVSLLIKGKHAVLPSGYVMNAYIAWDTWVELN